VAKCEVSVNKQKLALSQNQFDALVSYAFNIGVGAFERSNLLAMIKSGKVFECVVNAGFAFDFASVPRIFNGIVPYNDPILAWGALVHDVAFNRKFRSLKLSADLIHDVSVYFGYCGARARLVRFAVKTNRARRLWRDRDLFDIENSKYCNIRLLEGADSA
jgi:hypothetical protein